MVSWSLLIKVKEGSHRAASMAAASTDPGSTTTRSCSSFRMYPRVRSIAAWRSPGLGPETSIEKSGERSKPVDPVVIDRGSGHKAFDEVASEQHRQHEQGFLREHRGGGTVATAGSVDRFIRGPPRPGQKTLLGSPG
jgi:hypothetical protein